jgi:hypothetical protein
VAGDSRHCGGSTGGHTSVHSAAYREDDLPDGPTSLGPYTTGVWWVYALPLVLM